MKSYQLQQKRNSLIAPAWGLLSWAYRAMFSTQETTMEQAVLKRPPHPWATQTPGDVRQTAEENRLMLNPTSVAPGYG